VLSERKAGITRLMVHPFEGDAYEVSFEEEARLVYTMSNWELDNPELRFTYESMTTPPSVYDFNLETRERKLRKQEEVVGEFLPADYQSERLMVVVRDGVKVPVSIVWRKDKRKSDGNPLLLYGYGSYGISLDPYFSIARLSLLDRGFMFAIAHIRGGEEMGRQWYEEGKLLKKKNTFFDFIDVGEFLVKEQYAQKESLFAMGGSAGGLLMGAVINMRPELWKGVIAAVPFVDVLTTMLDDTIPLTTAEYDEWGNPNDAAYYEYIKSYSPYDNLKAANYPNLLVTTGLHDSQVQYWEPAKWVAKMRKLKTGENLLLLHTNMDTGHSGSPGRFERYKETAMDYAFLLYLMGIKQ
jgi:oligopeptidase B